VATCTTGGDSGTSGDSQCDSGNSGDSFFKKNATPEREGEVVVRRNIFSETSYYRADLSFFLFVLGMTKSECQEIS
jgi:hypothetical protein